MSFICGNFQRFAERVFVVIFVDDSSASKLWVKLPILDDAQISQTYTNALLTAGGLLSLAAQQRFFWGPTVGSR